MCQIARNFVVSKWKEKFCWTRGNSRLFVRERDSPYQKKKFLQYIRNDRENFQASFRGYCI